jgi:hypothetical protein
MDSAHPIVSNYFYTLKQTAEILSVPVNILLEWNENNILKPTITQNGEVGYTQKQISKFLAIREVLQSRNTEYAKAGIPQQNQSFLLKSNSDDLFHNNNLTEPGTTSYSSLQTASIQSKSIKMGTKSGLIKSPKKGRSLVAFGIISLFLIIIISLSVIISAQQNSLISPTYSNTTASQEKIGNNNTASASKISSVNYLESTTTALQVPIENNTTPNNDPDSIGITTSANRLAAPYPTAEEGLATPAANVGNKIQTTPQGQISDSGIKDKSILGTFSVNYGAIANYASRTNLKDTGTEVFDNEGNLKGDASSGLLVTTLGTTGVLRSDKLLRQTSNPYILLAFLTLGLFLVIFGYKKQLSYSVVKPNDTLVVYPDAVNRLQQQRIFEIDQKTDGTVVFYFQDEEYKVCKPELNSESDQFIERLLSFATEDVKEINYDIMKDKKIRVNAPLSKLVTRLGFVGLKRDLFFPRTSKNRVLFRRYITREDLDSMGLSKDNILNQLVS